MSETERVEGRIVPPRGAGRDTRGSGPGPHCVVTAPHAGMLDSMEQVGLAAHLDHDPAGAPGFAQRNRSMRELMR